MDLCIHAVVSYCFNYWEAIKILVSGRTGFALLLSYLGAFPTVLFYWNCIWLLGKVQENDIFIMSHFSVNSMVCLSIWSLACPLKVAWSFLPIFLHILSKFIPWDFVVLAVIIIEVFSSIISFIYYLWSCWFILHQAYWILFYFVVFRWLSWVFPHVICK